MSDIETQLFAHPVAVRTRATSDELMALVKLNAALDPSIFDESPPFFWSAEITNNRLDAYYTRMAVSSLRNYATDAAAGVSFQANHNCRELGCGRSLTGMFQEDTETARVLADFYTIPGLELGGMSTDQLIRGMRAGVVKDVSIGFFHPRFRCSICNLDIMRDWDCPHVPGIKYEVKNDEGEVTGEVLAFAWIEDARLAEVSAVYDGATPGAAILKAQREVDAGRMKPETARFLEQRYRGLDLKLPDARHVVPVGNLPKKEGENMTELEIAQKQVADVRVVLKAASVPDDKPIDVAVRELVDSNARALETEPPVLLIDAKAILTRAAITAEPKNVIEAMRFMEAELTRLRPLADDGTRYKQDLIDAAVAEGIRAHGEKFKEETQRALLAKFDLDTIKETTEQWRAIGDVKFPGGRQTRDDEETPLPATTQSHDAAYRVS